jgi:hypothetical protein
MPKLKLTVKKLDDVEEPFRPLYVEREDKTYELDAEGVPELRTAVKNANEEAKTLRLKYKGIDPEEVETLKAQVTELQAKSGPEAIESIKQQLLTAHGKEKSKLEARLNKAVEKLNAAMVEGSAIAAITAAGGSPALLLPHIKGVAKLLENDGDFAVAIVDSKGQPRVRDDGSPFTIQNLVEEMRANEQFGRAFDGSNASGAGIGDGGTGGGAAEKKRSKMSLDEKSAYIAKHGNAKYLALPY